MRDLLQRIDQIEKGMEDDLNSISTRITKTVDPEKVDRRLQWVAEHNPEIDVERLSYPPEFKERVDAGHKQIFGEYFSYGTKLLGKSALFGILAYAGHKFGKSVSSDFYKYAFDIGAVLYGLTGIFKFVNGSQLLWASIKMGFALESPLDARERQLADYVWMPEKEEGR